MVAGAVVTRRQTKVKKLSPLKVAKSPDLKMDTAEVRRLQLTDPTLKKSEVGLMRVSVKILGKVVLRSTTGVIKLSC